MARIVVVDDIEVFARMLAAPLKDAGHHVMVETMPIDFDRIVDFAPEAIVVGVGRQRNAIGKPIEEPERDILGYQALCLLEAYPALAIVPIALIGSCVLEQEIPTKLNYDLFLSLPHDGDLFIPKVKELALVVKTRRKLGAYVCPTCGSRMTYVHSPDDLFCPRDGTAVAVIENEECRALGPNQKVIPCTMEKIRPPARPAAEPPESRPETP